MISLTTKYAIRAIDSLRTEKGTGFVPIDNLSELSAVPAPYLAKILKTLAARGLIESKKGLNGGFRLNRTGKRLTMYDVAQCLDDPLTRSSCFIDNGGCNSKEPCDYHFAWSKLRDSIDSFLKQSVVWDPRK